jgi:pimeloyl-ACP methyl ester carboxylesterase
MTTIVLVHGAFVDGSSWSGVIPELLDAGHQVTAVQLPLTSLAEDVALTRQVIQNISGPTVVVGHSYGGVVISGAATDLAQVKSLVYIAAYAPAEGETLLALDGRFAPGPGFQAIRPAYREDMLFVDPSQFPQVFAGDVDPAQARVLAVMQKPINVACINTPAARPAWQSIPSWYLVSEHDQMINPDLQRFLAQRMQATTSSVPSSHASPVAHPHEVAATILAAAR